MLTIPLPVAQVAYPNANVRSGPGTGCAAIGSANQGQTFEIVGKNTGADWWQVCCLGDIQGWIANSVVVVTGSLDTVPIIQVAPCPEPWVILADFEGSTEGWGYLAQTKVDREVAVGIGLAADASHGRNSLRCDFNSAQPHAPYPQASYYVALAAEKADWTSYRQVMFDAKSLVSADFQMRITIVLATGEQSCWSELMDYQSVGEQWSTFTFVLDQPSWRTCVDNFSRNDNILMDQNNVRRLYILLAADGGEPQGSVLVDYVRLVRR